LAYLNQLKINGIRRLFFIFVYISFVITWFESRINKKDN
jgi:hypothetical protein